MPLEIAFVTETYPPEVNGVAMTAARLVEGLRGRGHVVRVLRPRQRNEAAAASADHLLPGLPLPGYPGLRFGLPAGRALTWLWRRQRPDLVHVVTEGPLGWAAVAAARRLGLPVTSGFHTNFDHYSVHYGLGWLRPAIAAYLRTLHRRTQATLVPTAALAAELAAAGIPGVRVVGRGVDTALFDPRHRDAGLRHVWGAGETDIVCLYVGRLAPEKNLDLAQRAYAAIREQQPGARMVWVGDGPSRGRLEAAHGEQHFAGQQIGEDLARHYASADLFIFPSLSETYGNVVAEAMASGLPVLAYRSAAAAELVADGDNGFIVPPGDEGAFIAAARAIAARAAGELGQMGGQARASMQPRHWAAIVERFEAVLREAIAASALVGPVGSAPR